MTMKNFFLKNKVRFWYMICIVILGLIDQRRGSAAGEIQMLFANCTGFVIAAMLLPSLQREWLYDRVYWRRFGIGILPVVLLGAFGAKHWLYKGQWITAILNVAVWLFFVLYIVKNRSELKPGKTLLRPLYLMIMVMLVLMQVSRHGGILPIWYLVMFGCFYLIGIPTCYREDFYHGILNGIICWFFIQQIIAFGFRPYDYVRYHGMYSGETQNGLFYMMVYCAFLLKWAWSKMNGAKRYITTFYFLMASSLIGFIVFTGGRAPLVGVVLATLGVYVWYDINYSSHLYKLVMRVAVLIMCVFISVPIVYGAIRYFPVILHHPVWFEGEYSRRKVHSYDPWNSEKYIDFETAISKNMGRVFSAIGIHLFGAGHAGWNPYTGLRVYAMETEINEPGDTLENPYNISNNQIPDSYKARYAILCYYSSRLNLFGHTRDESVFFLSHNDRVTQMTHAHNMFLQQAYDYGIPVGVLFLGIYVYCVGFALARHRWEHIFVFAFLMCIVGFGMFEMTVVAGQITYTLSFLMFYLVGSDPSFSIGATTIVQET